MHNANAMTSCVSFDCPYCLQCDENAYCEINMTDFQHLLRKGEEVKNPTDPCEMYHCLVSICTNNI